jgi:hypothetical protein
MRLLAARSHNPLVSCVMQLSLTRAKPEENEIAAKRHRGTPTVATRAGAHVFPPSNEPLAEVGACRRCELCPVGGMANIGLWTTRKREGEGVWGRGGGRGGEGRDHHVIDVAHLAQEPATPRLTTVARSFELRAHVYASFAHASGHTHCERFVRDIGRFVAVVKVYWLARVARSAPAAPVGAGWLASVFRARTTASLISANYTAGRAAGVWAWGAMRKARAVVMAGKLPSAVRCVRFGDCWRSHHVMRGGLGCQQCQCESVPKREKTAQRDAPERQPRALATCAAWKALAWAAWPLLEPAERLGCALWYLGYSGYSISNRG